MATSPGDETTSAETIDGDQVTSLSNAIAALRRDVAAHDEILNGSPTARYSGLKVRFERLETEVEKADLEDLKKSVVILEEINVKDGKTRIAILEQSVGRIEKRANMIFGLLMTAIVAEIARLLFAS